MKAAMPQPAQNGRPPIPWQRARGFTLMETLVAMTLAATILLPASFWLYHSRASRAALDKFHATQALESELNRAVLLRRDQDGNREISSPIYLRLTLHVERNADETRIFGKALDRQGRTLAELESGYFTEVP
jgi:prepilin-type N-terminal cleavage/methylation domain-containing protein